jgi:hypothetical protein
MGIAPAQRVRRVSLQLGVFISTMAFVWIGSPVLLDQWIGGYASVGYMFGTACLIAGASLALFGIIVVVGFVVARAFSEEGSEEDDEED